MSISQDDGFAADLNHLGVQMAPHTTLKINHAGRAAVLAAVFFVTALPYRAHAQFEGLLGSITDVGVFYTCWNTRSGVEETEDCPGGTNGYGFEILWGMRPIHIAGRQTKPDSWKVIQKQERQDGGPVTSTTFTYQRVEGTSTSTWAILPELALGYSQFSGFGSTDSTYELRGTVRELPAVTLYGTVQGPGILKIVAPYLGLRTGLIQLQNTQVIDSLDSKTAVAYTGTATAFQVGGAVGLAIGIGPINLTTEAAYHIRRFPSVHWGASVPARIPRSLDFSGPAFTIGLQVGLREPK